MKNKIEDIFLTYANFSLRDDISNLKKIYSRIIPWVHPDSKPINPDGKVYMYDAIKHDVNDLVEYLIERIITFARLKDPKSAIKNKNGRLPWIEETAFEAVYGYRGGFCEVSCTEYTGWDYYKLREDGFANGERINCLECAQLRFRVLLSEITKGKRFSNINWGYADEDLNKPPAFLRLMENSYTFLDSEIVVEKEKIEKKDFINISNFFFNIKEPPIFEIENFILCIAGYSLFEFLAKNNRSKLQICQKCKKFFIRSKNDNRIKNCSDCSGKSTFNREQRKQYQREYRKKKKQKELLIKREARIENLMKRAGCSKEEAIEFIEADEAIEAEKFA